MCGIPVVLAAIVVSGALAATAGAGAPQSASGTVTPVEFEITSLGQAGATEKIHLVVTSTMDGTFSGTLQSDSMEVVNLKTDNSTIRGIETCVCTVGGRSGTVVFRQVAKITGDPFFYEDTKSVISATGGLVGLRANLHVQWDGGDVASYWGTYHFEP